MQQSCLQIRFSFCKKGAMEKLKSLSNILHKNIFVISKSLEKVFCGLTRPQWNVLGGMHNIKSGGKITQHFRKTWWWCHDGLRMLYFEQNWWNSDFYKWIARRTVFQSAPARLNLINYAKKSGPKFLHSDAKQSLSGIAAWQLLLQRVTFVPFWLVCSDNNRMDLSNMPAAWM